MKHGVIALTDYEEPQEKVGFRQNIAAKFKRYRNFLAIVILPTTLTAAYLYLVASDQYVSEAHFIVRAANQQGRPSTGFGQLLGIAGGSTPAESEASSVSDYLQSHDAVAALQKKTDLVAMFRRSNADAVSRLYPANPTPETLLKYYRKKVDVHYDRDAGITDLTVKAFTREDAFKLATLLLELGEQRVNDMNSRSYQDAVRSSQRQLADAENSVAEIQSRMTKFRQAKADVDPEGTGQAQIKLLSELNGNLAGARAQLQTMSGAISHSSPQYIAMKRQVDSLSSEISRQTSKVSTGQTDMASSLGGYEDLKIRQEFAGKRYEMAAAAFDKAREEAKDQQLYVVRVVNPNMPVKSLFPQRGKIIGTTFIALLLIYSIGWLIAAGVKEHAS